jgi:hypothetical protein
MVLLAFLLWRSLQQGRGVGESVHAGGDRLPSVLAEWSITPPAGIHVHFRGQPPAPAGRDWLAALGRIGSAVTWSSDSLAAVALELSPLVDPLGGQRVRIASPRDAEISLSDDAGLLDSAIAGASGAERRFPAVGRWVSAAAGGTDARAIPGSPATLRPLLVIANAGWESKFAIAALEERGWTVDARVRVAPTSEITQGSGGAVTPDRYSAVIVMDSSSDPVVAQLRGYVRAGGGLVLAGRGAMTPALAAIAPARALTPVRGELFAASSAEPREGLAHLSLGSIRDDALVLERRNGSVVAAARREGAGRVVQVGETESWRVRMAVREEGPEDHRVWWTQLVGSAAHLPLALAIRGPAEVEAAPVAALSLALGEESEQPAATAAAASAVDSRMIVALLFLVLLLEWASRRLRGAR